MALRPDTSKLNLSFSGCAFLGVYHIGVCHAIRDHARWLYDGKPIAGASVGAIVAAGLITEVPLEVGLSLVAFIATKAREHLLGPFSPSFSMVRYLREGLNSILPENAHEICNNRLHVSLTRVWDRKNVIVSEYRSKQELIQALICSAFVPFYCGMIPPEFRGERYMDGSLSDNLPVINNETITIAPFAGESDICPDDSGETGMHITIVNTSMQCSFYNLYRFSKALFPPGPDAIERICRRGFDDALRYLYRHRLISCESHKQPMPYTRTETQSFNNKQSLEECSIRCGVEAETEIATAQREQREPIKATDDEPVTKFHIADDEDMEEDRLIQLGTQEQVERKSRLEMLFDEWRCAAEKEQFGMNPHCSDCRSRVQLALSDDIPQRITDVFYSTTLEQTLKLQVIRHGFPSAYELLTAPCYLPLKYSYSIAEVFIKSLLTLNHDLKGQSGQVFKLVSEIVDYLKKQSSIKIHCKFSMFELLQPLREDSVKQRPLGAAYSAPLLNDRVCLTPITVSNRAVPASRRIEFAVDFKTQSHSAQ